MQACVKTAGELGLDCWLISTPSSVNWYHRMGFKEVDSFSVNMDSLGGTDADGTSGTYTATIMCLSKTCALDASEKASDDF